MIKTITARELQEKISKKKLHLLDVREKVEYAMGHVPTAVNLPLSEFVSSYQHLIRTRFIISFAKVAHVLNRQQFSYLNKAIKLSMSQVAHPLGQEYWNTKIVDIIKQGYWSCFYVIINL